MYREYEGSRASAFDSTALIATLRERERDESEIFSGRKNVWTGDARHVSVAANNRSELRTGTDEAAVSLRKYIYVLRQAVAAPLLHYNIVIKIW